MYDVGLEHLYSLLVGKSHLYTFKIQSLTRSLCDALMILSVLHPKSKCPLTQPPAFSFRAINRNLCGELGSAYYSFSNKVIRWDNVLPPPVVLALLQIYTWLFDPIPP